MFDVKEPIHIDQLLENYKVKFLKWEQNQDGLEYRLCSNGKGLVTDEEDDLVYSYSWYDPIEETIGDFHYYVGE